MDPKKYPESEVIFMSDPVEPDDVTIEESPPITPHQCSLGAIVDVYLDLNRPGHEDEIVVRLRGQCRLYVVGHMRDSDGTPLYVLSDIPVVYPTTTSMFDGAKMMYRYLAQMLEFGFGEDSVLPTGQVRKLYDSIDLWLDPGKASN